MLDKWRSRARTGEAIAELLLAQITIRLINLRRWPGRFGLTQDNLPVNCKTSATLARHVERGAQRLPFISRCLPQALALSRMLKRRRISHHLVIAVRPASRCSHTRELHAWIEQDGRVVLGDLPGPWLPVLRLP